MPTNEICIDVNTPASRHHFLTGFEYVMDATIMLTSLDISTKQSSYIIVLNSLDRNPILANYMNCVNELIGALQTTRIA